MDSPTETALIILPLPSRRLSPNCPCGTRGARFAKAAAIKKYRATAKDATLALGIESAPWDFATATARFYWPDKRRRDDDNAAASIKSAWDGIVESGLLIDDDRDHLCRERPDFFIDPKFPRLEIEIRREKRTQVGHTNP